MQIDDSLDGAESNSHGVQDSPDQSDEEDWYPEQHQHSVVSYKSYVSEHIQNERQKRNALFFCDRRDCFFVGL